MGNCCGSPSTEPTPSFPGTSTQGNRYPPFWIFWDFFCLVLSLIFHSFFSILPPQLTKSRLLNFQVCNFHYLTPTFFLRLLHNCYLKFIDCFFVSLFFFFFSGQSVSGTSDNTSNDGGLSITSSSAGNGRLSAAPASESHDEAFPEGQILPTPNLKIFSFADLKTATRNFKSDNVLGIGGFGTVFKGSVDEKTLAPCKAGTGMVVAIKKLNPESLQGFQEWQVPNSSLTMRNFIC